MNYITHLNRFYARLPQETRFTSRHISLYLALFHCWNIHRFENPFPLVRDRVMQLAGLRSKDTYMKCLKDLHVGGYVIYSPALHKYHRPRVSIMRFPNGNNEMPQLPFDPKNTGPSFSPGPAKIGTGPVPDLDTGRSKSGQPPVPVLGHYNKTYINYVNRERETRSPDPPLTTIPENQTGMPRAAANCHPSLEEVLTWFSQSGYPETEASLFFNHYEANGWKLGGKAPITNWQAAAGKWMQYAKNIIKQNHDKPRKNRGTDHLHLPPDLDYSQPL